MDRRLRWAASASLVVVVSLGLALNPHRVKATSITVNTALDAVLASADGKCSLRGAILSATSNSNGADTDCPTGLGNGVLDVIQIDPSLAGQTLTLNAALGPLPLISNPENDKLQIIGPTTDATQFVISGGNHHRILELGFVNVGSAWLTLANLTLANGNGIGTSAGVNGTGGAIYAGDNTHLTLDNVVIRNNSVPDRGGGIFITSGEITNNGGAYVDNSAGVKGGGIFAFYGPTTYNGYALFMSGNTSDKGGAIAVNADPGNAFVHIERSLMQNNSAENGGVMYAEPTLGNGAVTVFELADSTAVGNSASGSGGVFFGQATNQHFRFLRSTFKANTGTGGLYFAGNGFIANSIVVDSGCANSAGDGPDGTRNLWGGSNVGCGSGFGNLGAPTGLDASLAQNGGPEVQKTFRLAAGSNAIDNGDSAWCGTIDARSVPRGVNGVGAVNSPAAGDCDIGAYEYAKYIVNFVTGTSTAQENGGTKNVEVKLFIPDPSDSPLAAPLSVPIARDGSSTARATIDYTIPPAGVTFAAGSTNGTIANLPVAILQDDIAERNGEFVIFDLQPAAGVAIAEPNTHNLSIQDDDQAGVLTHDGGNGTTVSEVAVGTADSFAISLRSRPDYSQPDPNDSNSYGPPADVDVTLEPDRDCTVTKGGATASLGDPITFTILNDDWQDQHALTVNAIDDQWDEEFRVETDQHTCRIEYTFSSGDPVYDATIDRYDVKVNDNDVNRVTIVESAGSTSLAEGGATDTYTVVLDTPPDPGKPLPNPARGPTVVTVDPDAQCNVGNGAGVPRALSFSASDWSLPKTVTATAVDDPTVELGHTCVITSTVSGGDPVYTDLSAAPPFARTPSSVTAAIQDYAPPAITNDPPFVNVFSGEGGLAVDESIAGTADTFTVVLERQPLTNPVTVSLTPSTDPRIPTPQVLLQEASAGSPDPSATLELTFTPATWNVPQTVRVFAVDDAYDESQDLHPVSISAAVASTAVGFNDPALRRIVLDGGTPATTLSLPVVIADDDISAVVVTESGGGTAITEGGATDTYTVALATHPYADVVLTATPDSQCDLGNGPGVARAIAIAAGSWDASVTVTATAVDDEAIELGTHQCLITHVATSAGDDLYDELAGASVTASVTDNDLPRVLITTGDGIAVAEATSGTPDTWTVVLHSKPDANVTVHVTVADPQSLVWTGALAPASAVDLTFTPDTYATPQTVSLQAVNDAVDETDPHASSIGHSLTTTATGYATAPELLVDDIVGSTVSATIADDDTAGITSGGDPGDVDVAEGGSTDSYTFVLTSQPVDDVTITPTADAQCTTSGPVTFTAGTWSAAQTITVTAVDDDTVEPGHGCAISHAATSDDPLYGGMALGGVDADVSDNDTAGVSITAAGLSLDEAATGTTASYSVVLDRRPLAAVTVTATVSDGQTTLGASAATTTVLTFTPDDWATPQSVTVNVVDDVDVEGTPHAGAIAHGVTSTAFGYDSSPAVRVNGTAGSSVAVAIADNELPTAVDDEATTAEDTAIDIDVLANDENPAPVSLTVGSYDATTEQGGTVTAGPGTTLHYTPPADFHGTDAFEYTASNGFESGPATVTVTVTSVNDAPSFAPGGDVAVLSGSGAYDAPWASGLSAGPADEAGQSVGYVISDLTNPSLFSAAPAVAANGRLTFTPAPGADGVAIVSIHAQDSGGTANGGVDRSSTVTFTIHLDLPPTITARAGGTCESEIRAVTTVRLLLADPDTSLDDLSLSATSSNGSLLPTSGMAFSGSGANRSLHISVASGKTGTSTIRVVAGDGVTTSPAVEYRLSVGTVGPDTIVGTAANDLIFGVSGNDLLYGGAGHDVVCGGAGNDEVKGDDGRDAVLGGLGDDDVRGGAGNDALDGGGGADGLRGQTGDDGLRGGAGADRFSGGDGTDVNLDLTVGDGDTWDAT